MPKVIQTEAEYNLVRQLIVDALTGDDNPLTRFVDRHLPDQPSSAQSKKVMYFLILSDLEEAAGDFGDVGAAYEDEAIAERASWRKVFEDSSYTDDKRFKGVFKDGK